MKCQLNDKVKTEYFIKTRFIWKTKLFTSSCYLYNVKIKILNESKILYNQKEQ